MVNPLIVRGALLVAAVAGSSLIRKIRDRDHGSVAFGNWGGSRRSEDLFGWSTLNGWVYDPRNRQVPGQWYDSPFGIGTGRHARDIATGNFRGRAAASFTYRWQESGETGRLTLGNTMLSGAAGAGLGGLLSPVGANALSDMKQVHVIAMDIPAWLPTIRFIPRDLADALVWKKDEEHVAVESAAFNDRWRVRARNVKTAHGLLHPKMIDRLLFPDAVGRNIRFEGNSILYFANGPTVVDNITPTLLLLSTIIDLVPEFIWNEYR